MIINKSRSKLDLGMKYVDSHSHWTDPRLSLDETEVRLRLDPCRTRGLDFFLQGGINPAEWQRQLQLKKLFPEIFSLCFGLHPYFVSDHTPDECEAALDELALLLPQAQALGETGLDFRPHIMKEAEGLQIEMFENQLQLAKVFKKPVVLHIVQAHEKALQILDIWGVPEQKGFVHAFNGSYETAACYTSLGFLISVGGALTHEKNKKLQDAVKKIPLEFLLLESDSPDQAPAGWEGLNSSLSVFSVAEKIAELRGIAAVQVLEAAAFNFKTLFKL